MQINTDYITTDACYPYNDPAWIIIHYTAGADGVTARDNAICFKREGAARSVGTHYFLGDDGIFTSTPEQYGAWTNGNWDAGHSSITIEVACGTYEPSFTETEIALLAELVPDIMQRYSIDKEHVIRHYDVADYFGGDTVDPHKACPRPYVDWAAWTALRDRITEGEKDMQLSDLLNNKRLPDGSYNNVCNALDRACTNSDIIISKIDKMQTGGVDYDKLAQAVAPLISAQIAKSVADELYNRLKA